MVFLLFCSFFSVGRRFFPRVWRLFDEIFLLRLRGSGLRSYRVSLEPASFYVPPGFSSAFVEAVW